MFEAKSLLKDTLREVEGQTEKFGCADCGLEHEPGGPCKECYEIFREEANNVSKIREDVPSRE